MIKVRLALNSGLLGAAIYSIFGSSSSLAASFLIQISNFIFQNINSISKDEDSDGETSGEAIAKKRENLLKLKETIYETLGKAWPDNTATQGNYKLLAPYHNFHIESCHSAEFHFEKSANCPY